MNINNVSFRGVFATKPVKDTVDKAKVQAASFGNGLQATVVENIKSNSKVEKVNRALNTAFEVAQGAAQALGIGSPSDIFSRKPKKGNHN